MSRVTFDKINTMVQTNLHKNYGKLADLQEQLSSGKGINRPSDAPIEITKDLSLRSDINAQSQFHRNMEDGLSYMSVIDSTMISTNDLMQAVRERAIQGSNDTNTSVERNYIAKDVREMLYQMVTISNTTYRGDYVFSGKNVNTPPFEVMNGTDSIDSIDNTATDPTDKFIAVVGDLNTPIQLYDRSITDSVLTTSTNGNPPVSNVIPGTLSINGLTEGTDYSVDYAAGKITFLTNAALSQAGAGGGIDIDYEWIRRSEEDLSGDINRQMEKGVSMQINLVADEVFGSRTENDTFKSIIGVLEGLHENNGAAIRSGLDGVDSSFERILGAQATSGARVNRAESAVNRGEGKIIESTRLQSEIEDLDFAKAISDFTQAQAVYQASLGSAAKVLQPSLADFL